MCESPTELDNGLSSLAAGVIGQTLVLCQLGTEVFQGRCGEACRRAAAHYIWSVTEQYQRTVLPSSTEVRATQEISATAATQMEVWHKEGEGPVMEKSNAGNVFSTQDMKISITADFKRKGKILFGGSWKVWVWKLRVFKLVLLSSNTAADGVIVNWRFLWPCFHSSSTDLCHRVLC